MTFHVNGPNPYIGLRPFRRTDAALFFGRDRETTELTRYWNANRLTVLHGPPGVGKSSLVAAGLLPRLNAREVDVLPVGGVVLPPSIPAALVPDGADPLVLGLLSAWSPHRHIGEISGLSLTAHLRRRHDRGRSVMAVIDQAEDIFRAAHWPRSTILDQLAAALDSKLPLHLLVVIRDDHVETLQRHDGLRTHMAKGASYALEPLSADAALQACVGPLPESGGPYAESVTDQLVGELTERKRNRRSPGTIEPVHLQVVCSALWEAAKVAGSPVTHADLRDVDQILARFCFAAIDEVSEFLDEDRAGLIGALRQIAERQPAEATPVAAVAEALVRRHVLTVGEKRRYEMPARLVGPFLAGSPSEDPRPTVTDADRLRMGETALHEGLLEVAARQARHVQMDPSASARAQGRAEALLADAAVAAGRLEEAGEHYRRSAQLFATLDGADRWVGAMLAASGHTLLSRGLSAAAVKELRGAVRRSLDPVIQTELAWALWYQGDTRGAIDILNSALISVGDAPTALRARGEILSDLGQSRPALRDLDRVPHELPATQTAYALALALDGRKSEAKRSVPPLQTVRDGTTLLRAARLMQLLGDRAEARRLARRAGEDHRPLPPPLTTYAADLSL